MLLKLFVELGWYFIPEKWWKAFPSSSQEDKGCAVLSGHKNQVISLVWHEAKIQVYSFSHFICFEHHPQRTLLRLQTVTLKRKGKKRQNTACLLAKEALRNSSLNCLQMIFLMFWVYIDRATLAEALQNFSPSFAVGQLRKLQIHWHFKSPLKIQSFCGIV